MGFRPNWTGSPTYVEYVKEYAEPDGRLGRLTILFSKAGVSQVLDSARLTQFVVTVQGTVDPVVDEIRTKAPRVMQPDMLHALQVLEGITEPTEAVDVLCDLCGTLLEEWTADEQGRITCIRPDTCEHRTEA